MLIYWSGIGYALVEAYLLPKVDALADASISRIVGPAKIDMNRHMNNAYWFMMMEQSRWSFMIRCNMFQFMVKNKLSAQIAGVYFRFRKGLKLLQRYRVYCRVVFFDDRWTYLEHRIVDARDDAVLGIGLLRTAFLQPNGKRMPFDSMLRGVGVAEHRIEAFKTQPKPLVVSTFEAHDASFGSGSAQASDPGRGPDATALPTIPSRM